MVYKATGIFVLLYSVLFLRTKKVQEWSEQKEIQFPTEIVAASFQVVFFLCFNF